MFSFNLPEVDQILRTVFRPVLVDQVFTANPLWYALYESREFLDGGKTFSFPIIHTGAVRGEGGFFGPSAETLPSETAEHIGLSTWGWSAYTHPVRISFHEEAWTQGRESSAISLLGGRMEVASMAAQDRLGSSLYGAVGTGEEGFLNLGDLFAQTNVYGGIDRSTGTFFRANVVNNDTAGGTNAVAFNLKRVNDAVMAATRGKLKPNLIITDADVWSEWWDTLNGQVRYGDVPIVQYGGFDAFYFRGIPVVWDPHCDNDGLDGNSKTKRSIYVLNTNYFKLVTMRGYDFVMTPLERIQEKPYYKSELFWFGNTVCTSPRLQSRLTNVLV